MLVEQRDDGFDVILLDDVENLGAFNQHTVQHLQDTWTYREEEYNEYVSSAQL